MIPKTERLIANEKQGEYKTRSGRPLYFKIFKQLASRCVDQARACQQENQARYRT